MTAHVADVAKVHQGHLEDAVRQLFPSKFVKLNARTEGNVRRALKGALLELDIWIPDLNLAFEFQDEYHYITAWYSHESLPNIMQTDSNKLELVHARSDTLILVPCWWDGTAESLFSTICFYRPDLANSSHHAASIISLNPPKGFFKGRCIPGIPELMLATFPKSLQIDFSRNFWWLGEKYDGIRFCWSPNSSGIYTRTGFELNLHEPFYNHMPSMFVDGELWFGRGFFMLSQHLLRLEPAESFNWPILRMPAFDVPAPKEHGTEFEERYSLLVHEVADDHPFMCISMRMKCMNRRQMIHTLRRILKTGGEGVILRKPKSFYELGRSENLIKIKAARGDMEALVVAEGSNFFVLKLLNGKTIRTPKPNDMNSVKPKKGDIVTVEYISFSKDSIPVSPKIVRIRKDVSWQDALRAYSSEGLKAAPSISIKAKIQRRLFFENFARRAGFHPYDAEGWYNVPRSSVVEAKGGRTLLQHYNNSLVTALITLFPEIEFKRSKFSIMPQNFWLDMANRREFFLEVARKRGFDPLVAENWYSLTRANIMHMKGTLSVLKFHDDSLSTAIMNLFPEIGLEHHKFRVSGAEKLESSTMRHRFLIEFAKRNSFDPLVADNWYLFAGDVIASENANSVLSYYAGDVTSMLLHIFPDIGLDKHKLSKSYDAYWKRVIRQYAHSHGFLVQDKEKWYTHIDGRYVSVHKQEKDITVHYPRDTFISRLCLVVPGIDKSKFVVSIGNYTKENKRRRSFFETFAKQRHFDPRVPEHWYPLRRDDFATAKGITSMLSHYKGGICAALLHLFPDVRWQISEFAEVTNTFWNEPKNRRTFFEHYAAKHQFDPLEEKNWLRIRHRDILSIKGGKRVLSFHDKSLSKALADLFPAVPFHSSFYNEASNRRNFFISFANAHSFDPLHTGPWYQRKHKDFLSFPGGSTVLSYYGGNYKSALIRLFPELQWKASEFM